jgi:beta-lactamase superfamily II metal-dependent hydrolase
VAQPAAAQVDITLIDVGQGDSILITFPPLSDGTRRRMLIDGGVSRAVNAPVIEFLEDEGITELDFVVLTHPHIDHYGGLIPVLNQLAVDEFWWTGERRAPGGTWDQMVMAMENAGERIVVEPGMRRSSQRARVEILMAGGNHPDSGEGEDINNDSLTMMLSYRGTKVLLPGDIEGDGGNDLVDEYCSSTSNSCRKLDADIIKIPHHGSSHLSARFVQLAQPEIGLISAGFDNRSHHHPRVSALEIYRDFGMESFYSTSASGDNHVTITIAANGDIELPDVPDGQTYTAWRTIDPDHPCSAADTHENLCLIEIAQGEGPD